MRGVVATAAALLVALASSGCFVEDEDPETDATDGTQANGSTTPSGTGRTATRSGSGTSTGAPGANEAPTADLAASAVNGTAPLNVTFAINGTDADGDALSWVLRLGDDALGNGTTVPANLTHSFTEAGNYTVQLTVSDGVGNATANVTIRVEGGGAGAGPQPVEHEFVTVNPDGTCDAKGERTVGPIHYHDRPSSPPQPGFLAGDGTWIYEESNDLPGLQIGGPGESADWQACVNPDTLIF